MKKSVVFALIILSTMLSGCNTEETKRTNQLLEQQIKLTEEIKQILENQIKQKEEQIKKDQEVLKKLTAPSQIKLF